MKKRKLKKDNLVLLIILFIFLMIAMFSTYKIYKWYLDSRATNKEIENINVNVDISEVVDNENTEIIEQTEEIDKSNPYWDYIKMNLIDVDFSELKAANNDIVGWITVNGTNINYPFVQTTDNDFYLTHSLNKKLNKAGWVFLDYRNNVQDPEQNSIIYAHARKDGTMFGTLKKILNTSWQNDTNNFIVKTSTEYENSLWQVFSIYQIPETNDYLQTEFPNEEEFMKFANMLIERSAFNFNTSVNGKDKILSLSTCRNTQERIVLHAKLIKKEKK